MAAETETKTFQIARHTYLYPSHGGYPRSRRELNGLHALGAILNKRNWWIKWTTMPDVRDKWLCEIGEAVVAANLTQVLDVWPQYYSSHMFNAYHDIAELSETERPAQIQQVLAHVLYPPSKEVDDDLFREGECYDNDREIAGGDYGEPRGLASDNALVHDTNFQSLFDAHQKKNPFCQIAWYISMAFVREDLLELPASAWDDGTFTEWVPQSRVWCKDDTIQRAHPLILAVVAAGPVTLELTKLHFPEETRVDVLELLCLHLQKIEAFLKVAKHHVATVLDLLIQREALPTDDGEAPLTEFKVRPGPVPQTSVSDDLIGSEIKNQFVAQVSVLENVPEEEKDWHPNSQNQVLDLVHPSLFCGANGQTNLLSSSGSDHHSLTGSAADHMRAIMFAPTTSLLATNGKTEFQWLPCEMDVDEQGKATIRSYINNLHPEIHPGLYDSIGSIFSKFVPLFDPVLHTLGGKRPLYLPYEMKDAVGPNVTPSLRRLMDESLWSDEPAPFTLKGRRCQVIVKMAEIVLTPEQPEYAGGSWHVEGTDSEKIVATGLYYFGCENITESRLSFRVMVREPQYEQHDKVGVGLTYGLAHDKPLVQTLGSVTAMEDRCVVFPNIYQHKVEPFKLMDPTKPGTRKILAFFLVNPTDKPIPSTAVVPPQQQEWVDRAMEPVIKKMRLPDGVSQQIQELARGGVSLEQAKAARLKLMEERSAGIHTCDDDYILFSLCEH